MGLYERTGCSAIRKWGNHVRTVKRKARCLDTEVRKAMSIHKSAQQEEARWKLLKTHELCLVEDFDEQKARKEEFWSSFQDRTRIINKAPGRVKDQGASAKYGMSWGIGGPSWKMVRPKPGTLAHGAMPDQAKRDEPGTGFRSVLSL